MNLGALYPPFARVLAQVAEDAHQAKVPLVWTSGYRSWDEQQTLWLKGRDEDGNVLHPHLIVTNARPGSSWHNFGMAADFGLQKQAGVLEWSTKADLDQDFVVDWLEVGRIGEGLGLEWGGRWKFLDLPHLQWKSRASLSECRKAYMLGGLSTVWRVVGAA